WGLKGTHVSVVEGKLRSEDRAERFPVLVALEDVPQERTEDAEEERPERCAELARHAATSSSGITAPALAACASLSGCASNASSFTSSASAMRQEWLAYMRARGGTKQ